MVREDLVDHVAIEQSPDGSERVSTHVKKPTGEYA